MNRACALLLCLFVGAPALAEPGQKRGEGAEIEPRQLAAARAGNMNAMMQVQVRQMQMGGAGHQRQRAEAEAHQERDEVEIRPGHERLLGLRAEATGFNTSIRRSASPGFSSTVPSSTMHMRESAWRATASRA